MVYTLRLSSSKCSLFHNSNVFGSCIIHILYIMCAKIQKNNSGAKRLIGFNIDRNGAHDFLEKIDESFPCVDKIIETIILNLGRVCFLCKRAGFAYRRGNHRKCPEGWTN